MNEIIFFSSINGLADSYPIKESFKFKFDWVERARTDYKERVEHLKDKNPHVYRCPGIFELLSYGYILPLPYDVIIDTEKGYSGFSWTLPSKFFEHELKTKIVDAHTEDGIAKHFPKKEGSLPALIKINTPWHIIAPTGIKFMIIPIPYPDSFEFESVHGILDPAVSTEVNIQIRWNVLEGKTLIKAGTPMCQIIPISEKKFKLTIRDKTAEDAQWLDRRNYINNSSFLLRRPLIKEAYKNFFSKWKKWI